MTSTTFFFVFIPLLAIILLAVNLIFAPHNPYQEKDSAFECGFHSFLGQNRTQFSISFFIFALLFLLFDLEILLVYPYVVSAYTNGIYGLTIMLIFFLALTLGFAFELGKNALKIDSRQMLNLSNFKVSTISHISSFKLSINRNLAKFPLAILFFFILIVSFITIVICYISGLLDIIPLDFFIVLATCTITWTVNSGIIDSLSEYLGIKGLNFNLKGLILDKFSIKLGVNQGLNSDSNVLSKNTPEPDDLPESSNSSGKDKGKAVDNGSSSEPVSGQKPDKGKGVDRELHPNYDRNMSASSSSKNNASDHAAVNTPDKFKIPDPHGVANRGFIDLRTNEPYSTEGSPEHNEYLNSIIKAHIHASQNNIDLRSAFNPVDQRFYNQFSEYFLAESLEKKTFEKFKRLNLLTAKEQKLSKNIMDALMLNRTKHYDMLEEIRNKETRPERVVELKKLLAEGEDRCILMKHTQERLMDKGRVIEKINETKEELRLAKLDLEYNIPINPDYIKRLEADLESLNLEPKKGKRPLDINTTEQDKRKRS